MQKGVGDGRGLKSKGEGKEKEVRKGRDKRRQKNMED